MDVDDPEGRRASDVKAIILCLRRFSQATDLEIFLGTKETGFDNQVPWQQREIVLGLQQGAVTSLALHIEAYSEARLDNHDVASIIQHFQHLLSLELDLRWANCDLIDDMWPESLQKVTLRCDGFNVPQFLRQLIRPSVLPNLRYIPQIKREGSRDGKNKVVSRWMVDQAVTGFRLHGGVVDFEMEKLSLYDLVNEGLDDIGYAAPGWLSVREPEI